ncbi:hypothetical protein ICM_05033 [Bacillus cereus BAG1X2-3]|nr:hypothetical protein ICC_05184 [Bacillus cereus BAG1X1-1]EOO43091.1 hypothetical protein ICI_06030 [Bacillus cereus BAG1X2-1]EOO45092.1 hypothetical protein ICK_05855 [Bacillus cereus BAG1X2-2]EOO62125.1 hypothetical protein ICM_05033 [Bacillus cereus BAG1X2-3]EOP01304.1 hypothetical protein ICO_05582 [Bacillus cereus BAG2O-1]
MFILMNIIFYKDIIKYVQNKDWVSIISDITMSLLIVILGSVLYTILYLVFSKPKIQ